MSVSPKNILINILSTIDPEYKADGITLNQKEIALAKAIGQTLTNAKLGVFDVDDDEETLIFSDENSDPELNPVPFRPERFNNEFDYEYIRKVLEFVDNNPNVSFDRLRHHFRKVVDRNYIRRFREYFTRMGTNRTKFKQINEYVFQRFREARENDFEVHGQDLRLWALEKADELQLPRESFVASDTWINRFKNNNQIVSRKITKFITLEASRNVDTIETEGLAFHLDIIDNIMPNFEADEIWNFDQSGIQYENHGGRTLSFKGLKDIEARARSMNSLTHSYTITPVVTMSGKLLSPLSICLQEPSGRFGPIVEARLRKPSNMHIVCTKSGKMTKELMIDFKNNVLNKMIGQKACIIKDSWTGQSDSKIFLFPGKDVQIRTLPEGSTRFLQPLDLAGFRQWKNFIKRFSQKVILEDLDIELHDRNNIIQLNSLILNQFQSPKFYPIFMSGWRKAGFDVTLPENYESLKDISFNFEKNKCDNCQASRPFIKCSWCEEVLCMKCFFQNSHYHNLT